MSVVNPFDHMNKTLQSFGNSQSLRCSLKKESILLRFRCFIFYKMKRSNIKPIYKQSNGVCGSVAKINSSEDE